MTESSELSDSLYGALSKARIPVENHKFIRKFVAALEIDDFCAMAVDSDKPYVSAVRRDRLPDLRIYYGFTNGFVSEEELVRAAGCGVERGRSRRGETWYVAHPTTRVAPRGEHSRDVRRQAGFCSCGMQVSVTGVCGSCD